MEVCGEMKKGKLKGVLQQFLFFNNFLKTLKIFLACLQLFQLYKYNFLNELIIV